MGRFLFSLVVLAALAAGGVYAQWTLRALRSAAAAARQMGRCPARPKCAPEAAKAGPRRRARSSRPP